MEKGNQVTSVVRLFGIIEQLSNEQYLSLGELARRMYMSKSTLYRTLQTMIELGYAQQDPETEKYALTMRLFQTGAKAFGLLDINKAADMHMQRLSRQMQETVHLAILDASSKSIIYTHKVDTEFSLAITSRIGSKAPVYCTALGKVLTAYSRPDETDEILSGLEYRRFTEQTIHEERAFREELKKVRESGYAEDIGEHERQIHCIAVPIFDALGNITAGMSITWPDFRFEDARMQEYIGEMKSHAADISAALGFCPEDQS